MSKLGDFAKQFVKIGIENFEDAECFRDIKQMLPKYVKKRYGDGDLCIFHAGCGIDDVDIKERMSKVYDQFFDSYFKRTEGKRETEALALFAKMYKSFLLQNKPNERQFIQGMLNIVNHFIVQFVKNKEGWDHKKDFLFGWSPKESKKKSNTY